MFTRRAWLRLGLLAFLLATFLGPIGAGAGNSVSCDDFANPDAAQHLLDIDDSYAEDLDPDGDGIACNDDPASSTEPGDYFDALWDEVETMNDSFATLGEAFRSGMADDVTEAELDAAIEVVNAIAETWRAYPESAPEFDVPAGYEHLDEAYRDYVASVGEAGEAYWAFWNAADVDEGAELLEEFDEVYVAAQEQAYVVMNLISEAELAS